MPIWTKENENKLKVLYLNNIKIGQIAKILGMTYNAVFYRVKKLQLNGGGYKKGINVRFTQEERLKIPYIRENICIMYIDKLNEKVEDPIGYVAKACDFTKEQVIKCITECRLDGIYQEMLFRIKIKNSKGGVFK